MYGLRSKPLSAVVKQLEIHLVWCHNHQQSKQDSFSPQTHYYGAAKNMIIKQNNSRNNLFLWLKFIYTEYLS